MADEGTKPQTPEAPGPSEPPPAPEAPAAPETPAAPQAPAPEAPQADEGLNLDEGPTLDEAQAWKGFRLDEMGGTAVGKVEGVYVDESTRRPEWLLARMGRFGHHCLVPARDAVAASGHVWVPYSRDLIRKGPRIEPNQPLERGRERALLEHYGVGSTEVGRGADLAKGDADAVTARPA